MRVGVPTEIKNNEFRVGLSPASVREYVGRGHEVTVQAGAGAGIRYRVSITETLRVNSASSLA